jgi:hypothetical protein
MPFTGVWWLSRKLKDKNRMILFGKTVARGNLDPIKGK